MDPAQLVLNNREIEPCVSCAEQKDGIWRVGLRLPKALASVGRWESFLLDARRNPEDQWMTRRSPWVSQRVTRDSLVFLDLPKSPVRRHAVMLLRKPGSEHVAAVVLDIVPSPAGKP